MSEEFNPMLEPKIDKPYVADFIAANLGDEVYPETPIPEFKATKPPVDIGVNNDKTDNPTPPPNPQPANPQFQGMSASEQRINAEKSAEALIQTYRQVAPAPFIMLSSFNMRKINKLHKKGEIDLHMVVTPDRKTIGQYMENHNVEVEKVFIVDDDTCESIKEPLIDVLMEKQLVLSPMTRLLFSVGNHVAAMGKIAIELYRQKADEMDDFREFREKQLKLQREGYVKTTQPVAANTQPPSPEFEQEEILTETAPKKESVVEKIVKPPVSTNEKEMDLNEYLNKPDLSQITNDDSITI